MQIYTEDTEQDLAKRLRHLGHNSVGWWAVVFEATDESAVELMHNKKLIDISCQLISDTLNTGTEVNVFVCRNASFIICGKGARNDRLEKLGQQLSELFSFSDADGEETIKADFEATKYDLSISWADFTKKCAHIIFACEKIKDAAQSEGVLIAQKFGQNIQREASDAFQAHRNGRLKKLVMFIEDDRSTHSLLRHLMSAIGYNCELVFEETAEKGLKSYFEKAPDVLFLDINLPDASGLDALNVITQNDRGSKVIMLSADAKADYVKFAMENGAKGFIGKPFTKKKFEDVLQKLMSQRKWG